MAAVRERQQGVDQRPVAQLGGDRGVQRGGHHRPRPLLQESSDGGVQVVALGSLAHRERERVGEQRHDRSPGLGRRALVGGVVLAGGIVGDVEPRGHTSPFRVRRAAKPPAREHGELEILACDRVGVGVVADPDEAFVHRDDVVDVVAPPARVKARPARPEVGSRREHRVAVARQPCGVARGEIVLPLREGDVARDVILVQGVLPGEARGGLVAQLVRFPRIHRTAVAVRLRVAARRRERAVAKPDH